MRKLSAILFIMTVVLNLSALAHAADLSATDKLIWHETGGAVKPEAVPGTIADILTRASEEAVKGDSAIYKSADPEAELRAEPVSALYFTTDQQCRKIHVTILYNGKTGVSVDREFCVGLDMLMIPPVRRIE